jgi:hypothetical protein
MQGEGAGVGGGDEIAAALSVVLQDQNVVSASQCHICAGRFWFNPDWNGGTDKGAPDYSFELWDVYSPGGGWALARDPAGTRRSSR